MKNSPKRGVQSNQANYSRRKKTSCGKQETLPSLDRSRNDGVDYSKCLSSPRSDAGNRKRRKNYLKDTKSQSFDFPSDRNDTNKGNNARSRSFCGSDSGSTHDHYENQNFVEVMQISQEVKEKHTNPDSSNHNKFATKFESKQKILHYASQSKIDISQSSPTSSSIESDWRCHETTIHKERALGFVRYPSIEKRPRRDSWAEDHSKASYSQKGASSLHSRRNRCVSDGIDSLTKHFGDVTYTYSPDGKLICVSPIAMSSFTAPPAFNYRLAPTISQHALAYPGQQIVRSQQYIPRIGVFPRNIRNTNLEDIQKKSCSSQKNPIPLYSHTPIPADSQSACKTDKVPVQNTKLGRYAGSLVAIYADSDFPRDFHLTNESIVPSYPYVAPLPDCCNPALFSKAMLHTSLTAAGKVDLTSMNSEIPPVRYAEARKYVYPYNYQLDSLSQSCYNMAGNSPLGSFFRALPNDRRWGVNLPEFPAQKDTTTVLHNSPLCSPPYNNPLLPLTTETYLQQDVVKSPASTFSTHRDHDNNPVQIQNDISIMREQLNGENDEKNHPIFKNTYTDYHHRKRKLLSAAENLIPRKTNRNDFENHSVRPERKPGGVFSKTLKTKYSSEDDVIARECTNHHVVSEAESDDSGRPSSV